MALISKEGLAAQQARHDAERYGVSGWRWAPYVNRYARKVHATSVLDYGCGDGSLAKGLYPLTVRLYDPVTAPRMPAPTDLVVCTDVLPFVEPECLDDVLGHIKELAERGVFIAVPDHPAHKGSSFPVTIGWWETRLASFWPRYDVPMRSQRAIGPTPRLIFRGRAC